MTCTCSSTRIIEFHGKTDGRSETHILAPDNTREKSHYGNVLYGVGIGGGDYVHFKYCADCGRIQGKFPLSDEAIDEAFEE